MAQSKKTKAKAKKPTKAKTAARAAKKPAARKSAAKKPAAKRSAVKKTAAKKTAAKKTAAKKTAGKKRAAPRKKATRCAPKRSAAPKPAAAPAAPAAPPGELVGEVTNYIAGISVAAIRLSGALSIGDNIAIRRADGYLEQPVESMQIDRAAVQSAGAGDEIGIKVAGNVHEHNKVYKI